MKNNKFILMFLSMLILIPMVLAQWGGYYFSPLDYLNNEWVLFTIIALVFFAVIFYTVNKAFKNKAVAGTIAIALALLIAMTFSQKMLLYGFMGEDIGTWVFIVVLLISLGFVIKFVYEGLGGIGAGIAVIGVWILLNVIDPYQFFPTTLLYNEVFMIIYNLVKGIPGLIAIVVLAFILLKTKKKKSLITIGEHDGS